MKSGYDVRIVEDRIRGTYVAHERAENEFNSLAGKLGKKKKHLSDVCI
jgi:hypothetical protein